MKSGCKFEELFEGYFNSDLSPAEEIALQNHLKSCSSCSEKIEKFYSIHSILKSKKRPLPSRELIESYYKQVDLTFGPESLSHKIALFFSQFSRKRSPLVRTAQIISLLIVGLAVGWFVFAPVEQTAEDQMVVFQNNDPYQMSQPISSEDIAYIYYYLQASEMVLLEVQNNTDPSDFYLDRELAKKLLIKTLRVKEIALQIQNLRLINFLSYMELLFHEASNLNMEEMGESLGTLKVIIKEAGLLNEVKILQTLIQRTKDQIGA